MRPAYVSQFLQPPRVQFIWRSNWNRNSYKANLIAWKSLTNDAARHKDRFRCKPERPLPPCKGTRKCCNCCLQQRQPVCLTVWQHCLHSGHRQWHRLLKPVWQPPRRAPIHTHSHTYIHTYLRLVCVGASVWMVSLNDFSSQAAAAGEIRPGGWGRALRCLLCWLCLTFSGPRPFGIATNTNGTLKPRLSTGTFSLPPNESGNWKSSCSCALVGNESGNYYFFIWEIPRNKRLLHPLPTFIITIFTSIVSSSFFEHPYFSQL